MIIGIEISHSKDHGSRVQFLRNTPHGLSWGDSYFIRSNNRECRINNLLAELHYAWKFTSVVTVTQTFVTINIRLGNKIR